ncbi:DUF4287 domain-containing protein [Shewanella sp. SNU WT4]|uniref:DUF4287 domain-containing protein n=1 Tax=Shewanella sp. SNU WT4 TaxID=2590015 RepID=UPI001129F489|nr:DUF4287 domain-containing protein [Shewanella sp. SNU WT4]QDF67967.1 DUF4287 domain-containing protein [Shewanella sp. SNU WT4]
MADMEKALASQLANIETRSGKTMAELMAIVNQSGLVKHGERLAMLKTAYGMGHGDANLFVHMAKQSQVVAAPMPLSDDELLTNLYPDKKAPLLIIHQALLVTLNSLGPFIIAPKQNYISYRRNKQFCMIGPATNSQIEIGLNIKHLEADERLKVMPAGQMCQYKLRLSSVVEIDAKIISWLEAAYLAAG